MGFAISDLKNILDRSKASPQADKPLHFNTNPILDMLDSNFYIPEAQNWYTAKPYGFKTTTKNNNVFAMFLPISPSNLTISTSFATNMITTLYGTVEEHSDVRYYDIVIEGTTSMAPKFVEPSMGEPSTTTYAAGLRPGRSSFSIAQGITLGGFFSKTLSTINDIKNKAAELQGGGPKVHPGFTSYNSGYMAFHNLYRFLLQYKKDAAGSTKAGNVKRKSHPLTFFNYKDNNQYDVVVRNFTMRRSVQDPMLYYYTIQLRGYNLRGIKAGIEEDVGQRLKDLGLNGVDSSSVLGDIKSLSQQAKSIVASAVGGISVLGR